MGHNENFLDEFFYTDKKNDLNLSEEECVFFNEIFIIANEKHNPLRLKANVAIKEFNDSNDPSKIYSLIDLMAATWTEKMLQERHSKKQLMNYFDHRKNLSNKFLDN